jgi:outer membrane protein assembly factor BamB
MPSWLGGSPSKSAPPTPLVEFKPSLHPRTVWTYSLGSARGTVLQPAVLENAIYAASSGGNLVRLGPDGAVVWRIEAADSIAGGVGSDGLVVVVGTPRGEVLAFGADGKPMWQAQLNAAVQTAPLVGRGLVLVRGSDHRITAFDSASGKRRWTFQRTSAPLTLKAYSDMAFAGELVVSGFPSGRVVALAAANGAVRWDVPVSEPRGATEVERLSDVMGAPLTSFGDVCAASFQGRIACINAANGNLRWARELSAGNGPGGDSERVYGVDSKSNVLAFSRESGSSVWRQDKLLNRDLTTPLALRRAILVGDYAGYLHFLSPQDGGFLARVSLGSEILAAPVAFAGGAIVQTSSGTLALVALE